jgi:iron-sulfur cluster assembly accessory protein
MCLEVTDRAAVFINRMVRLSQGGRAAGFRVTAKPGGCSGFASEFSVEEAPAPGDRVFETNGVRLFMPPDTCDLLRGHVMDFAETRLEGGFSFHKPGAAHACACGSGAGTGPVAGKVTVIRPGGSCGKHA